MSFIRKLVSAGLFGIAMIFLDADSYVNEKVPLWGMIVCLVMLTLAVHLIVPRGQGGEK